MAGERGLRQTHPARPERAKFEFDINHRKISGYTITGSELVQEKPPVVMVSGTIEDRIFKMRVPDKPGILGELNGELDPWTGRQRLFA